MSLVLRKLGTRFPQGVPPCSRSSVQYHAEYEQKQWTAHFAAQLGKEGKPGQLPRSLFRLARIRCRL